MYKFLACSIALSLMFEGYTSNKPQIVAVTEGDPSSFVSSCVNAVTGDFFVSQEDVTIEGLEPIHLKRFYVGGHTDNKLAKWSLHPHLYTFIHPSRNMVHIPEPSGATLSYSTTKKIKKGSEITFNPLNINLHGKGLTNSAHGEISGRTNLKNNRVVLSADHSELKVYEADGSQRCYTVMANQPDQSHVAKEFQTTHYSLAWEKLPHGNKIIYSYDGSGQLSEIRTTNPAGTKTYAWAKFRCNDSVGDQHSIEVETSNSRKLQYKFRSIDEHTKKEAFVLEEVSSDGFPEDEINYHHTRKTRSPLMSQRYFADGQTRAAEYYNTNHNFVGGIDVYVNGTSDPRCNRVKALMAPIGENGKLVPTHSFFYKTPIPQKQNGVTEVFEADGSKKVFHYSPALRLQAIEQYASRARGGVLLFSEQLIWGDEGTKEETFLLCRTFFDHNKTPVYSRRFWYDESGNVKQEKFYGNLSGKNSSALSLSAKGLPEERNIESYAKRFSYSEDGRNLLVKVEEENGVSELFSYVPGTDLLSAKMLLQHGEVKLRHLYEYNEDLILVRAISDNGSSTEKDNLSGVTVRKIQVTVPRQQAPFLGMPERIEERYLEVATGEEKLLKRTDLFYSPEGFVSRKEIYGADNKLAYTLHSEYDSSGNVVEERNALGQVARHMYDSVGNKILTQDYSGKGSTRFDYDFANRLIQKDEQNVDGLVRTTSYKYDFKGNKILTIDPQGNETRTSYDSLSNEVELQLPLVLNTDEKSINPTELKQYNALGLVTTLKNPKGLVTARSYNARKKPTLVVHPDGTKESFVYNLDGTLKEKIDAEGNSTHFTYDEAARVTSKKIFSASGELLATEQMTYDGFNIKTKTDAEGNVTVYTYDGAGRKICEAFGQEKTHFSYDSLGRLHCIEKGEEAIKQLTYREYDLMDRLIEERVENRKGKPLSRIAFEYDGSGNTSAVIRFINGEEAKETFLYDAYNRLIEHTDALGSSTKIHYDDQFLNALGQYVLQKTTEEKAGITTVETFDALSRLVSSEKRDGSGNPLAHELFFYDEVNNLSRQISALFTPEAPAQTIETRWQYDSLSRLISLTEAYGSESARVTQYSYTPNGKVKEKIKPDGVVLTYTYDNLGNLTHLRSSDDSIEYAFEHNRLGQLIASSNLKTQRTTRRELDASGRVLKEVQENGLAVQNSYDLLGRKARIALPDHSAIRYVYDPLQLKRVIRHSTDGILVYMHHYGKYDLSGNLLEERPIGGLGKVFYTFNPLGQKSSVSSRWFQQKVEAFDSAGNIGKISWQTPKKRGYSEYQYDALKQLIVEDGAIQHTYTYDSHQNRLSKDGAVYEVDLLKRLLSTPEAQFTYDLSGNLTCKRAANGETFYVYDALDRLIEVNKPKSMRLTFTYDSLHRRQDKTSYAWKDGQWVEKERFSFLYDGSIEIGAVNRANELVELRVLGRDGQADIGSAVAIELKGDIYAPLYDLQGSVAALLSHSGRKLVDNYQYSAFGEEKKAPYIQEPWRFSSKRMDTEVGLIYFGMRYYDPKTGHWLTPDPEKYVDGPNLYAFALNNPLSKVDLMGLRAVAQKHRSCPGCPQGPTRDQRAPDPLLLNQ